MKLRPLPLLVIACVIGAFGAALLLVNDAPPELTGNAGDRADSAAQSPSVSAPERPLQSLTPDQQAILEDPRTLAFERRLDFQADVHNFFDQVDQLGEAQKKQRAETLKAELEAYEKADEVSAMESLMLQLALIKTTIANESEQQQAMAALIEEYKTQSEARKVEWKSQPRPAFDAYKAQEKAIVEEVMALERIPGDMDRNEYLRQKLMEARIEAAGNDGMD